jgi:hypothetical protein
MRKIICALVAVSLLGVAGSSQSEEPKKEIPLMQRKLQASQKVLEGVAVNDFDKIGKNAEELLTLSKLAEWRIIKSPRYEMFSGEFQRTAETLIKNAKDKNLDAAALTYVELTLTCVKCHKYVREVRMTRAD